MDMQRVVDGLRSRLHHVQRELDEKASVLETNEQCLAMARLNKMWTPSPLHSARSLAQSERAYAVDGGTDVSEGVASSVSAADIADAVEEVTCR